MKRVLVTGAAGFIGRPACWQLRDLGWQVIGAGRRERPPSGFEGIEWVSANFLEKSAPAKLVTEAQATHMLHLAWVTEHGAYWESPQNHAWVEASKELLCAFAALGGRRAVLAGTCAEYDWNAPDPVSAPPRPATLYGRSKLLLHDWAQSWAAENKISVAWGRVFFPFGPGENPQRLVPYVCRQLLRGEPALCGSGTAVRDFIPVEDLARGFAGLLTSDAIGDFDLGRGAELSIRELVETLARLAGRPDLPRFGARPDPSGEPALLVAKRLVPGLSESLKTAAHLETSLRATLDWWRRAAPPAS